jgi:hypothetical protein
MEPEYPAPTKTRSHLLERLHFAREGHPSFLTFDHRLITVTRLGDVLVDRQGVLAPSPIVE